jgi:hypothetical protein
MRRSHGYLAISAAAWLLAAPGQAQELPACAISGSDELAGIAARAELRVARGSTLSGGHQKMEGRYFLTVPAATKASAGAPDSVTVRITHTAEGARDGRQNGHQSLVVEIPGVVGTANRAAQPTVELSSNSVPLGKRNVSAEGNVLFLTDLAGGTVGVEQMDLGKRLGVPRADLTITVRDAAGKEIGTWVVPARAIAAGNSALSEGYAELGPAASSGQCKIEAGLDTWI